MAHDFESAVNEFNIIKPDFIILDLDLGNFSKSGYDFLSYIRKHPSEPFICIHSNQPYYEKSNEHKVDAIIPKPMTQITLQALLSDAKSKKTSAKETVPKVAIVDDEEVFLSAWKLGMTDADVICFNDHEIFWDAVLEKPQVLRSLSAIILDYYFPGTNVDKLRLVHSIRSRGFSGPIILSTNAPYKNDGKDKFDAVINKTPLSFSDLIYKVNTFQITSKQV